MRILSSCIHYLSLILFLAPLVYCTNCPATGKPGIWSTKAVYLCSRWNGSKFVRDISVPAPDGDKVVHVTGEQWTLEVAGKRLLLTDQDSYVSYYPAELGWAPDSKAFYIVQSDATSEINGFRTAIFVVGDGAVRRVNSVNTIVANDFLQYHRCIGFLTTHDPEDYPNVAAFAWLNSSARLLIIAELVPHSSCRPMGYFAGYLVSINETRVLQKLSPQQIKEGWGGVMGPRLRDDLAGLNRRQKIAKP